MDASKISLQTITDTVKPYANYLDFRRVSDYFEDESVNDGRKYKFRIFQSHLTIPASVTMESRVYAMDTSYRHFNEERVDKEQWLLRHTTGSDDNVCWFCWRTTFVPASLTLSSTVFWSKISQIVTVEDPSTARHRLPEDCWRSLDAWILASMRRREAANALRARLSESVSSRDAFTLHTILMKENYPSQNRS